MVITRNFKEMEEEMKIKFLACVISLLLVVGFSSSVSAAQDAPNDTAGNHFDGVYDIDKADVKVFPPDATDIEMYLKASLDMYGKLPGLVLLEFDVDNDTATGGKSGMVQVWNACESGGLLKPKRPGFDVLITLTLRDQDASGSSAWCSDCFGKGGQCFVKCAGQSGDPCNGDDDACAPACGGTADCYYAQYSCDPVDDECYKTGAECQDVLPDCDKCYELTEECAYDVPCEQGREIGEWYATATAAGIGGGTIHDRGRIDIPQPKEGGQTDDIDCYTFPWKRIVEKLHAYLVANPPDDPSRTFDLNAAKDPTNYRWQISTWYDDDHPTAINDFMDESAVLPCNEVTDVIPNDGAETVTAQTGDICYGDFDNDGDIDGRDVGRFKNDSGRQDCPSMNPTCECTEGLHPAADPYCGP